MKTRIKFRSVSKRAKYFLYPTMVLVVVNFFAFISVSVLLGGDALNGYVHTAHYFLCAHGHCTEVSGSTWNYSWWHAVSALGGILLVFAEMALLLNTGDIHFE
jgi:hypothetical protein